MAASEIMMLPMKQWTLAFAFFMNVFCGLGQDADFPPPDAPPFLGGPSRFGPGGDRPGGPMEPEIKLLNKFDKDGNKRLDSTERRAAREYVVRQRANEG